MRRDEMESLASRLKTCRKARGFSQQEVAHGLGVKRIREAHPEADPALYDLTLAHEILWRHPTE